MASRASRLALGVVAMLVVGCGAQSDDAATSPTDAPTSAAPPALDDYLLRADEVPGLEPVSSPQTDEEEPFDLPEGGTEVMERSGYISTTFQPAVGDRGAGVSSVVLFESEDGARDWMAYETSAEVIRHQIPGARIKRFRIPGVPGARGWTGPDRHGNAIGQAYWTQGRCIYERTGGECPT